METEEDQTKSSLGSYNVSTLSKKHFATFDLFVKMKLVPTVQAETPQP